MMRRFLILVLLGWLCLPLAAQQAPPPVQQGAPATDEAPDNDDLLTVFPHTWQQFWLSGQMNFIAQGHFRFHAPYSAENSMNPKPELAVSRVLTLFTGWTPCDGTEFVFDAEETGGHGISEALGLAGFTNLDVVRNPTLGGRPYIARLMLRQVIGLGTEKEDVSSQRGPFSLSRQLPVKRIDIWLGKFSLADFLDLNSIGSDSHLQFLNWTIDNNGAWDYAADTRGYTVGALIELHELRWSVRFAEALMPEVANGPHLEWNLRKAHGSNLELELRPKLARERSTTIRLLGFRNVAHMGSYRAANADFLAHRFSGLNNGAAAPVAPTAKPDIVASERGTRTKYGFGLNAEQEFTKAVRGFLRLGWNDDKNESFAYTEVARTAEFGGDVSGAIWRRKHDRIGAALVVNALGADHRRYLELGGSGFLLGDGRLNYGYEKIFESYYTVHLWRGVFASGDVQYVANPGYNRDRGPVIVPALRLHVEL
jgi:high affinity Mn2+ porin